MACPSRRRGDVRRAGDFSTTSTLSFQFPLELDAATCVRLTTKQNLPRLAREEYTPGHGQRQHQDHQRHDPHKAELDLQTMIDFR